MYKLLLFFPLALFARSLSLESYLQEAAQKDPILAEARFSIHGESAKINELKKGVILPRFQLNFGIGPAPSVIEKDNPEDPSDPIQEYDFTNIGPAMSLSLKVAQPLNLSRLNAGLKAARANAKRKEWEVKKIIIQKDVELQKIYFGYLYAKDMHALANKTLGELQKLESKIEDLLDEDDESVSQFDLLELKANMHVAHSGVSEAKEGFSLAQLGLNFSVGARKESVFPSDSTLGLRTEKLPSFDELKMAMVEFHPDLKQLELGLEARRSLVKIAKLEMGPEFFIFGSVDFTKSWSSDQTSEKTDAFVQDPFNKLNGVFGLGVRYNLNFWKGQTKVAKEKQALSLLKRKDQYALDGLFLKLEEKYLRWTRLKENIEHSANSLRASESWLKGAAMKYDVDPSEGKALLGAFKNNVSLQQVYAKNVYKYNSAFADVLGAVGWTLSDYLSIYSK